MIRKLTTPKIRSLIIIGDRSSGDIVRIRKALICKTGLKAAELEERARKLQEKLRPGRYRYQAKSGTVELYTPCHCFFQTHSPARKLDSD